MSNWVEELGTHELTDKQAKMAVKFMNGMSDILSEEDDGSGEEFTEMVLGHVDIALHNLNLYKKYLNKSDDVGV